MRCAVTERECLHFFSKMLFALEVILKKCCCWTRVESHWRALVSSVRGPLRETALMNLIIRRATECPQVHVKWRGERWGGGGDPRGWAKGAQEETATRAVENLKQKLDLKNKRTKRHHLTHLAGVRIMKTILRSGSKTCWLWNPNRSRTQTALSEYFSCLNKKKLYLWES